MVKRYSSSYIEPPQKRNQHSLFALVSFHSGTVRPVSPPFLLQKWWKDWSPSHSLGCPRCQQAIRTTTNSIQRKVLQKPQKKHHRWPIFRELNTCLSFLSLLKCTTFLLQKLQDIHWNHEKMGVLRLVEITLWMQAAVFSGCWWQGQGVFGGSKSCLKKYKAFLYRFLWPVFTGEAGFAFPSVYLFFKSWNIHPRSFHAKHIARRSKLCGKKNIKTCHINQTCGLTYPNQSLRIQSPSRMMIGCIITSLERYLGSITILRRWARIPREYVAWSYQPPKTHLQKTCGQRHSHPNAPQPTMKYLVLQRPEFWKPEISIPTSVSMDIHGIYL